MTGAPRSFARRTLTALAIFIVAGAAVYFAMGGNGGGVNYRDPGLIARGESLFSRNCASCHGKKAVGESPRNVKGGEKPGGGFWAPALNGTAHAWHHPPDGLFRIIEQGSPAAGSTMAGWGGRMSGEEIHAVLAYIQSLWPEELRRRYEQAFPSE